MKKQAQIILISALILLQLFSLSQVYSLKNELHNANGRLSALISEQSRMADNINANIDASLKRQASIIDSYKYTLGVVDIGTLTVPVTFVITPKTASADTAATLFLSDKSAVMARDGMIFSATVEADIFCEPEARVVFADGDTERTEKLDTDLNLRYELLPVIIARAESENGTHYSKKAGEPAGEYRIKSNLNIDVKPSPGNTFGKINLIIDVDGNIISEKTVELKGNAWFGIDEKIPLSAGQKLTMYVSAEDNFGLIHKAVIDRIALDENADVIKDTRIRTNEVTITDRDGNILYAPLDGEIY
jgi:hypothetical protein